MWQTAASSGWAADSKPQSKKPSLLQDDFPFQGACISASSPANNTAMKGLAIRVGNDANMLFDTELLRMSAGWTGGYISTRGVAFDGGHGQHPKIEGNQKFGTRNQPGWANAKGKFTDPRSEPFGPLPSDWCRWDGLYVSGMDTVLSYTVLGTKIYEQPSSIVVDDQVGFVRTFQTDKSAAALTTVLCEIEGAKTNLRHHCHPYGRDEQSPRSPWLVPPKASNPRCAGNNQVLLKLAKGTGKSLFKVVIWKGQRKLRPNLQACWLANPK